MSPGVRNLAHFHLHRNPAEAVRVLDRCPSAGVAEGPGQGVLRDLSPCLGVAVADRGQ